VEETEVLDVEVNETAEVEELREEGRESVSELKSRSGVHIGPGLLAVVEL
jgi:hypothetical protein